MQEAMKAWPSWKYETPLKNIRQGPQTDEGPIATSNVFAHIAFKNKPRDAPRNGSVSGDIPYLRPVGQSVKQEYPDKETLLDHPIVWRTFATFPPMDITRFHAPFDLIPAINGTGVIVNDITHVLGIE